jgi:cysteine desulfurase
MHIRSLGFSALALLTACSSGNDSGFLDYAASYSIDEDALAEFNAVSRLNGNSSGINPHSKALQEIEKKSAEAIAKKIGARPEQIVFVNNSTMATNLAILGVAYDNLGCHMITSKIEHKSVLNVFKHLESAGYKVTYLNVDPFGNVDLKQLKNSISKKTKLISIQTLNSEIGTIQNVKAIGEIAKKRGLLFHSDAAQSFCKYDINVDDANLDLLTLAGYKIGAPKGIAALYVRDKSRLQPILFGSGDPFFPGTKPTPLIASLAFAVENFRCDMLKINRNFHALVSELKKIKDVYVNSATPSHVVSVSIGGILLKDLMERMKDYSFSSGCSCLGQGQSNVMEAIDPKGKLPTCTIRVSFSDKVTPDVLVAFAQNLKKTVYRLRSEKSVGIGCSKSD